MTQVLASSRRRDFLIIHRLQFPLPVGYLCCAVWGSFFAAGSLSVWKDAPALLGMAACLLLIVAPLALNVAVDTVTDARHDTKGYLADAASRFGAGRALAWAGAETAVALVAVLVLGLVWHRWWPLAAAALIGCLQLLYNTGPLHLKGRGVLGSAAFGTASVGLPCFLGYTAVSGGIDTAMWLVLAGISVLATGRTVWWSVPDHAADSATGVGAPGVRHGPAGALAVACGILASGVVLLAWALWLRYGAWSLLGIAAHVIFTGRTLAQLPPARRGTLPSPKAMLRREMPIVTAGDVLLALVPLLG